MSLWHLDQKEEVGRTALLDSLFGQDVRDLPSKEHSRAPGERPDAGGCGAERSPKTLSQGGAGVC